MTLGIVARMLAMEQKVKSEGILTAGLKSVVFDENIQNTINASRIVGREENNENAVEG